METSITYAYDKITSIHEPVIDYAAYGILKAENITLILWQIICPETVELY